MGELRNVIETKAINVMSMHSHVSRLGPSAFEDLVHFSQPQLLPETKYINLKSRVKAEQKIRATIINRL